MNSPLVRIGENYTLRAEDILVIESAGFGDDEYGLVVQMRGIPEWVQIICDDKTEADVFYGKAIFDWESALTGARASVTA